MQNQRRRHSAIHSKSISKSVKIHVQNKEGRNVKIDQKVVSSREIPQFRNTVVQKIVAQCPQSRKIDQKSIHAYIQVAIILDSLKKKNQSSNFLAIHLQYNLASFKKTVNGPIRSELFKVGKLQGINVCFDFCWQQDIRSILYPVSTHFEPHSYVVTPYRLEKQSQIYLTLIVHFIKIFTGPFPILFKNSITIYDSDSIMDK